MLKRNTAIVSPARLRQWQDTRPAAHLHRADEGHGTQSGNETAPDGTHVLICCDVCGEHRLVEPTEKVPLAYLMDAELQICSPHCKRVADLELGLVEVPA